MRLTTSTTEYLQCHFSDGEGGTKDEVTMRGEVMPSVGKFIYLGLIIQEKRDIDKDINQCIKVGWQKWKNVSRVLSEKKITLRLKEKVTFTVRLLTSSMV